MIQTWSTYLLRLLRLFAFSFSIFFLIPLHPLLSNCSLFADLKELLDDFTHLHDEVLSSTCLFLLRCSTLMPYSTLWFWLTWTGKKWQIVLLSRIFVTILRAPCEPMSSGYHANYCYNPKFFGFLWSCARHLSALLMMWRKILFGSTNFNSSYFVFCCCEQIGTLNTDPNVVVPHEPYLCECECLDCS
jgi:hypothetical protein